MTTTFLAPVPLRYSAFICYAPADDSLAGSLHTSLETYAIPAIFRKTKDDEAAIPARLYPIFLDKEELPLAAFDGPATKHLLLGLKQSRHLLVVVTPRSAGSMEVEDQIRQFAKLGVDRRIVCVVLDAPGDTGEGSHTAVRELLPKALRELQDGAGESNRVIVLDERGSQIGKTELRLRVVAALTGLDYDTLRQRDSEQFRRRTVITTVTAIVFLIAFAAMATELFRQMQFANEARQNAATERARVLQKRDQIFRQETQATPAPTPEKPADQSK